MGGVGTRPTTGPPCSPASSWPASASGLINPAIADVAVSVVPKEQSGMASGINDTFRQVGIAIGIAAWGAIFLGRGADKVEQVAAGTPAATGDAAARAGGGRLLRQPRQRRGERARRAPARGVADAAREGFLAGLNEILMLGGIFAVAGAVAAAVAGPRAATSSARGADRGGAAEFEPRRGAGLGRSSRPP